MEGPSNSQEWFVPISTDKNMVTKYIGLFVKL